MYILNETGIKSNHVAQRLGIHRSGVYVMAHGGMGKENARRVQKTLRTIGREMRTVMASRKPLHVKLLELRERCGLNFSHVARKVGVTPQALALAVQIEKIPDKRAETIEEILEETSSKLRRYVTPPRPQ